MIGMAVGDQRPGLRLRRIDPGIGGPDVNAFGKRLDPGTETGHRELYGRTMPRFPARQKREHGLRGSMELLTCRRAAVAAIALQRCAIAPRRRADRAGDRAFMEEDRAHRGEATALDKRDAGMMLPPVDRRLVRGARAGSPRRHQLEMLAAARAGRSALLVAPTGAGKTLAGFLPSLVELVEQPERRAAHALRLAAEGAGGRRAAQPARPRSRRWACRSGSRRAPATRRPTARRASGCGRRRCC